MGTVRFRSCSIEGTRGDAVLAFREAVAEATSAVFTELDKLNALPTQRRNEAVVLNGVVDSTLIKDPVRDPNASPPLDTLVVRSKPDGQGHTYRKAPLIEKEYTTTVVDGGTITQGKGGLRETYEYAIGQWLFQNIDGTPSGTTDGLTDSTYYSKHLKISGSAPSIAEGPLGYSRTLGGSTYFTIPTKMALGKISMSQMLMHDDMSAWAWVKTTNDSERTVLSFSSPPEDPLASLPGLAALTLPFVTILDPIEQRWLSVIGVNDTTRIEKSCRIIFSSQPDRVYEVKDFVTNTSITLTEVYSGPVDPAASMRLAYSKTYGITTPPESRNTLYGLSLTRSTSKIRFYWQRNQRETNEVYATVPWNNDEFIFVGVQRRNRKLGTVNKPAASLTITGSGFAMTFGVGSGAGKFIRFVGDGVTVDDRYYEIDTVINDTTLTLKSNTTTLNLPDYDGEISSVRLMLHVGKLDGSFNTFTFDHKPGPTGGISIASVTSKNALGNYFVGHDEQLGSTTNFIGAMNAVSMYSIALDTEDAPNHDARIRRMFSRSFPDYVASGKNIRRSALSDITDGQTVYCDYQYTASLATALATTNEVGQEVDGMLVGLDNPTVKNTSQLAQTIKTPDPALQDDIEHLNRMMTKYNMMVANGQPFVKGSTDMSAYNALVQTVGSVDEADKLVLNKPLKSFVLVITTEDTRETQTIDSCGRQTPVLVVTERIVAINKNLREAAVIAGTDNLKLKIWWLGKIGLEDTSVMKLRNYGLTGSQISTALSGTSTDTMQVYVIPVPDVAKKLRDAGLSSDDVNDIAMRPADTTTGGVEVPPNIPIDTAPSTDTVAAFIQKAMASPNGTTVDGDQNPLNPALITARTIDLKKALTAKTTDLFPPDTLNDIHPDCQALIAIVDDMLVNMTNALQRVNVVIVPFAIKGNASIGNQKLAFQKYIPCVANVSASFALPPFHLKINKTVNLLGHLMEQVNSVANQAQTIVDQFNDLLCIPRTLIAAIRGGVCGIEQPAVVADRQCPSQLDLLLDRLKALVETIGLMLRKILEALLKFSLDVEFSIGAASSLAVDATIPCIGPVANFLTVLGG